MTNRLDRTGEPVDEDTQTTSIPHHCNRGWRGTDGSGNPIPCLVCKPHLAAGLAEVYDYGKDW